MSDKPNSTTTTNTADTSDTSDTITDTSSTSDQSDVTTSDQSDVTTSDQSDVTTSDTIADTSSTSDQSDVTTSDTITDTSASSDQSDLTTSDTITDTSVCSDRSDVTTSDTITDTSASTDQSDVTNSASITGTTSGSFYQSDVTTSASDISSSLDNSVESYWEDESPVPDLRTIILNSAQYIKGPDLQKLIESANPEQRKNILERVPSDSIPLEYALGHLDQDIYWKILCQDRWPGREIWKYNNNWKSMYIELTVQDFIENFDPVERDISELREFLNVYKCFILRLKISKLKKRYKPPFTVDPSSEDFDDKLYDLLFRSENDPDFLSFEAAFGILENLQVVELDISPSSTNEEVSELSVADFNSFLKGMRFLKKLLRIKISNGILHNHQIEIISRLFVTYDCLREVDFSYNCLDDGLCDYIGLLLLSCPLETLILRYNKVSDSGVEVLAAALSTNNTLKKLDLAANSIGEKGAQFLVNVLLSNCVLEDLDVSQNRLNGQSGVALASVIESSKSLLRLNIAENKLGKAAGRDIQKAVKANLRMILLEIRFCGFASEDEDGIHQALLRNRESQKVLFGERFK